MFMGIDVASRGFLAQSERPAGTTAGMLIRCKRAVAEAEPAVKKKSWKNDRHENRAIAVNRAVRKT
jgi:hypothetical protein